MRNRRRTIDTSGPAADALPHDGAPNAADQPAGWRLVKGIATVAGLTLGATAAVNAAIAMRTPPLDNRLGGTFNRYPTRHGDIAYTVSGSGSPVLLLHGLGAGNSMVEWDHNFHELARHHTVYALDFLGWGLADRSSDTYKSDDFIEQIQFFAEDVIGAPCAVIASSQSCAFAVQAAHRDPSRFTRLVLVCPAGADGQNSAASALPRELLQAALKWPVIGTALYNLMVSRGSIERFACRHLFFDKSRVTEGLVTRYHIAAHQAGSKYALASLLDGSTETDWHAAWAHLEVPALMVWGRNALIGGLDAAPEYLALKPDARLQVIERAMLLPHVEHAEEFNRIVLKWLAE